MPKLKITTPLSDRVVQNLRIAQRVLISGVLYTACEAAHKKLIELLDHKKELPFDLNGQVIYYVLPSPAKPGQIIGSAGPEAACRMDAYTARLIALGLKGMIGKDQRSLEVVKAIKQYKSVYFAAVGGAAALIASSVKECSVAAFPELGQEAVHRLVVEEFPVIVANDALGGDLYNEGVKMYMNRGQA